MQTGEALATQTVDTHNGEQRPNRTDAGVTNSRGKEVASESSNRKINLTVCNSTFTDTTVSRQVREVGRGISYCQ